MAAATDLIRVLSVYTSRAFRRETELLRAMRDLGAGGADLGDRVDRIGVFVLLEQVTVGVEHEPFAPFPPYGGSSQGLNVVT
jgi:hypothetical protein